MTKYITPNDSDWLDDLDLVQLRGMSVRDADALLSEQAEGQWHTGSRAHPRHRVCETPNLDDALDDDDAAVPGGESAQQVDAKPHATHTLSQFRRDAEREHREQTRIEAQSQRVLRQLYQRHDSRRHRSPPSPHSPRASSQLSARPSPRNQHQHGWHHCSKPFQQPNVGTTQGNFESSQRRHTHDQAQR